MDAPDSARLVPLGSTAAGARRLRAPAGGRFVLWFTGLSGAGKSTLANALAESLREEGMRPYVLDGDVLRRGLNADLGVDVEDRRENIRRAAHVASLLVDAGMSVLTAFISPFREERELARRLVGPDSFVEIYVACPLAVCERRDPKGLYRRARSGLLPDFTGIDSPYEAPTDPDITIRTDRLSLDASVAVLRDRLKRLGVLSVP